MFIQTIIFITKQPIYKTDKLKIQIVSFVFPPQAGIGGRRWAKFSKYFHSQNIDFRVIAAKPQTDIPSQWLSDISEFEDRVTYIESDYPDILSRYPDKLMHKLRYRYAIQKAKFKTAGNYYDKSIYWLGNLEKEITKNFENGYQNLIISGAPFHQMELVRLKEKLPGLKIILDFRDPWVNNRTAFGFKEMSTERQTYELELEKTAILSADAVVYVAQKMADYFIMIGANKSICIPNGFDLKDYSGFEPKKASEGVITCVFAGSLYNGLDLLLNQFIRTVENLNRNFPNKIHFKFIGTIPNWVKINSEQIDSITISEHVSKEKALMAINDSDFGMLFLTEDINYSVSSKMLDYIALSKPILCFSKTESITGRLIEEKGLGYSLNLKTIKDKLIDVINNPHIINQEEMDKLQHQYELETLSMDWITLINALKA
jgi:hypothetical protein